MYRNELLNISCVVSRLFPSRHIPPHFISNPFTHTQIPFPSSLLLFFPSVLLPTFQFRHRSNPWTVIVMVMVVIVASMALQMKIAEKVYARFSHWLVALVRVLMGKDRRQISQNAARNGSYNTSLNIITTSHKYEPISSSNKHWQTRSNKHFAQVFRPKRFSVYDRRGGYKHWWIFSFLTVRKRKGRREEETGTSDRGERRNNKSTSCAWLNET